MTAASTPPSSSSAMASSGVKCVTCRCERLLGKPLPQRWIWASTICIACFLRRCGRKYPRIAAAPDKYETDDADRRGEHDVKTRRQVVAGHRDEPGRDKRGKTAEDRHCDGEAQRYADAAHGSRKEFGELRRQHPAVTGLDEAEPAGGKDCGCKRRKSDHQKEKRPGGEEKEPAHSGQDAAAAEFVGEVSGERRGDAENDGADEGGGEASRRRQVQLLHRIGRDVEDDVGRAVRDRRDADSQA